MIARSPRRDGTLADSSSIRSRPDVFLQSDAAQTKSTKTALIAHSIERISEHVGESSNWRGSVGATASTLIPQRNVKIAREKRTSTIAASPTTTTINLARKRAGS